ncbi:hypothetical protein KIL84_017375 [Mauremys mutica]|uniref:Uncharacterized protein n=1 Tax=Mauremys mutica TaxID=74926 RepID=A0A9D4AYJ9_9SAUR|nr:hypothetical protein KIL84_017375 [Mauremys mutica]
MEGGVVPWKAERTGRNRCVYTDSGGGWLRGEVTTWLSGEMDGWRAGGTDRWMGSWADRHRWSRGIGSSKRGSYVETDLIWTARSSNGLFFPSSRQQIRVFKRDPEVKRT